MVSRRAKKSRELSAANARLSKSQQRQVGSPEIASEHTVSPGPSTDVSRAEGSDQVPRVARKARPIVVGNMSPKSLQARKKAQFEEEAQRIRDEGQLWDRCDYCEKFSKRCRIALYNKARQRTIHCLECFLRSKPCSHNEPDSAFRKHLKDLRERQDLLEGNMAAISRQEEREAAEKQRAEEREEQLLARAEALRREEFRVRADEAATQRATIRAQLRWRAGQQVGTSMEEPSRKSARGSPSPIVEELSDSESNRD